jgi:hypothetical protein
MTHFWHLQANAMIFEVSIWDSSGDVRRQGQRIAR